MSLGWTSDVSWKLTGEAGLEADIWEPTSSLCPQPPGEVYQRLQCSYSGDTGAFLLCALETTAMAVSPPPYQEYST